MAPKQDIPTHAIDRTPEYDEFMEKLKAFHAERGTTLDAEPKVGAVHLDLYKVFNHIVQNGGYDKICDEKLAWRRMAAELGLNTASHQVSATAFSLKERFYKNLAAYEIKTIHNQEPPPKDILEDVTAKGGGLLTRTRENFFKGPKASAALGAESAASGDDGTPARERPEADTPGSSARASRGLRHAPPQRVMFQPDTSSSRPTRHSSAHHPGQGQRQSSHHAPSTPAAGSSSSQSQAPHGTPTPALGHPPRAAGHGLPSAIHPPSDLPPAIAAYNPREVKTMPLRPVDTPRNNPAEFARRKMEAKLPRDMRPPPMPRLPPGSFDGSNIYIRCLNALRCDRRDERMYALHHWVRISYERTEKFRFDAFPGLDEGLVEAALRIGSLFFDVEWSIVWDASAATEDNQLDGEKGTSDILERIKRLSPKMVLDNVQPDEFRDEMLQVVEAVLTIRNMITMTDNAVHIAGFPPVKDLICIVLNLPNMESVGEVKNYVLDIAELITPYMSLKPDDPFYQTLLGQLDSEDRGTILTALRAIGRISMNLEETNKLGAIPAAVLEKIATWILQNDDDFTDACLDFLYQYTAVETNVDKLLRAMAPEILVAQLVRLLSHGARRSTKEIVIEPERKLPAKDTIPAMPDDLRDDLVRLKDPERIHQWVKCFFDHDPDSFVTQIAAWQAYNGALSDTLRKSNQPVTSPAEFIRNCSSIYQNSQPQVLTRGSEQQKFIIGGIRARDNPLSIGGREYAKCSWETGPSKVCGKYFLDRQAFMDHIFDTHLGAKRDEHNKFKNVEGTHKCNWSGCKQYRSNNFVGSLAAFARHIGVHIGNFFEPDGKAKKPKKNWTIPAKTLTVTYEETATTRDEKAPSGHPQAAGIPLSAVLVLRNIARNVTKTQSEEELLRKHELGGEGGGWNERLFRPWMGRLWEIVTENRVLAPHVSLLITVIKGD